MSSSIADYATLVGLAVTFIGWAWSIFAATGARTAAREAAGAIRKNQKLVDLSSAIGIGEEIKRLHRTLQWAVLPDRYSTCRTLLIQLKRSSAATLTETQQTRLQSAIGFLSETESYVEKQLLQGGVPNNQVAKLNFRISRHIDELNEFLVELDEGEGLNVH
jgi:hypothetical protein